LIRVSLIRRIRVFSGGVAGGLGAAGSGNSLPRISRIGEDKTFFDLLVFSDLFSDGHFYPWDP
jgi:hypothetical protein